MAHAMTIFLNKFIHVVFHFRAHTFCTSRKPWFKHLHAGVDIDAINYAIKHMTKIKAKFSCGDQINFNELVVEPGSPE